MVTDTANTPLDELGFYVLAGQPDSTRDLIAEIHAGEELGFGTVFLSERYNKKEAGVQSGAVGAVSERL
jgi:5,10-methylenetetrahydromethanopterin reductase